MSKSIIKLATRKSPMALWQANFVARLLKNMQPAIEIELVGLLTQGDKDLSSPLNQSGGKSLFVKELQQALLSGTADIAVHCVKDMSVIPVDGLSLVSILKRDDPRDAFLSTHYSDFSDLPSEAIVGSSSPRRQSQLLSIRPDLIIKPLRGNVGTRLDKLQQGDYQAIILSAAGLERLNKINEIKQYFETHELLPCIGQGALGIECRSEDREIINFIKNINHLPSQICVIAERAVNQQLKGDCYTPIAAHARIENHKDVYHLLLQALVGSLDGKKILRSKHSISLNDISEKEYPAAQNLGISVANDLLSQGAKELLHV